ncbi:7-carboxy-7-deazaguanine synthase [Halomonas llamarensis]|uniref:7-carboxy-7-deazaguanine synthase n=1 Tax=Halomonas llamarensis TaxID=2945104 RepID=A0ABT0SMV0_9GAMM|nr:7-carboxy-7-deazaguanine synthase [Halomonas llamarensis]MCL7929125.1 7-carboxy-7-deazaguanine synthase [Halomonas llamarensis]
MYHVKEAFYTLQGEGAQAGRASVFCRFSGCNLWSGREKDRSSAQCQFCDTDFIGTDGLNGGRFHDAITLAIYLQALWPNTTQGTPYIVFTGGEPLLQLDKALIDALHEKGFDIAVETNGTLPAPEGIDWLCVSPKGRNPLVITQGQELKLVYPQDTAAPEEFADLAFTHFFLQPMDSSFLADSATVEKAVSQTTEYCLSHPQWRLSMQIHKIAGFA